MEDVAFEVQPGEPAALPNRPRNRHKRDRDVSHLCPTSVRLAQRKDELLKAWRDRKTSASAYNTLSDDSSGKKSRKEYTNDCSSFQHSANASSETDDSKDEEYTVSDEDDYSKNVIDNTNDIPKVLNDSSEEDSCKEIVQNDTRSPSPINVNNTRHHW